MWGCRVDGSPCTKFLHPPPPIPFHWPGPLSLFPTLRAFVLCHLPINDKYYLSNIAFKPNNFITAIYSHHQTKSLCYVNNGCFDCQCKYGWGRPSEDTPHTDTFDRRCFACGWTGERAGNNAVLSEAILLVEGTHRWRAAMPHASIHHHTLPSCSCGCVGGGSHRQRWRQPQ